jgi:hypothetical protein
MGRTLLDPANSCQPHACKIPYPAQIRARDPEPPLRHGDHIQEEERAARIDRKVLRPSQRVGLRLVAMPSRPTARPAPPRLRKTSRAKDSLQLHQVLRPHVCVAPPRTSIESEIFVADVVLPMKPTRPPRSRSCGDFGECLNDPSCRRERRYPRPGGATLSITAEVMVSSDAIKKNEPPPSAARAARASGAEVRRLRMM